jgi:pimeloyl-ACP methyl ester carboxylesterase
MSLRFRPLRRRAFLEGAAALAMLSCVPNALSAEDATGVQPRTGQEGMAKDIVMLHGASEGGWCFDKFRGVFEGLGWTCHAPDLIGRGKDKAGVDEKLGLTNYRAEFAAFLETLLPKPVLLGHSRGAVRALILVSPAPRAGILPSSDSEKDLSQSLMGIASFWKTLINPDFDLACFYPLNLVPKDQRRGVFDSLGLSRALPISRCFFGCSIRRRPPRSIRMRCVARSSASPAPTTISFRLKPRGSASTPYRGATFWEEPGHGHMLPVEPGAEDIAPRIEGWIPA